MRALPGACDHAGMSQRLAQLVVRHTLRLPRPAGGPGQGAVAARQFDVALMAAGFKLSAGLLESLSGLSAAAVVHTAVRTLPTVREMAGDHVRHNAYFIDFPANVPDTEDFWRACLVEALTDPATRDATLDRLGAGAVDLLTLPSYGSYQHTYDELLAAHDALISAAGDRVTVLHPGGPAEEEIGALYLALAGSPTPLGEDVLSDLRALAAHCANGPQPETFPVRENRAVVNEARLTAGAPLLLDTVTDVLRLACALSGGSPALQEPTPFRTMPRPVRRALLAGLDSLVAGSPARLADVHAHRERWKRLGERLHPHEYPRWPHAAEVFAVARGESAARTFDSRVEELLAADDVLGAARVLEAAPGRLLRSLDRLLRTAATPQDRDAVVAAAERVAPKAAGRVVLAVREHLDNRPATRGGRRVFVNRSGRAWVVPDDRRPLPDPQRRRLVDALDAEFGRRLPSPERLLVDPEFLDVALPLSGRATTAGLGVLPRGSASRVDGELLRFFVYWKQARETTDFDLSAILLDARYRTKSWLDYTALSSLEGEHSGDITSAPDGASEFINLRLDKARCAFIVPQVNIFAGEGFEEVEESFFGFMLRDGEQRGRPFEPRTVRMKSELRGRGKVALPLVFRRGNDGRWTALWLHLYLRGMPDANRVAANRATVESLLRPLVERRYLTVRHLVGLMAAGGTKVTEHDGGALPEGPVTYLGSTRPEGLHPDSVVVTPGNLRDVIPA